MNGIKGMFEVNRNETYITSNESTTQHAKIPNISSSRDRTDRRIVQYISYAENEGYNTMPVHNGMDIYNS